MAVSSYSPTISLLLSLREQRRPQDLSMLAVIQSSSEGALPLPGTKEELNKIRGYMDSHNIPLIALEGQDAKVDSVLNQMKECSLVHFACHGIQDPWNALKSGLLLNDGTALTRILRKCQKKICCTNDSMNIREKGRSYEKVK